MNVRFCRDPETDLPHIYDHWVSEEEVRQVLARPAERFRGRKQTWIALGQTEAGRYLQVVFSEDDEPESVFVITAYDLRGKALKALRRRRRRKPR